MRFIPFGDPMPGIDYEYHPQETVRDAAGKAMKDFYDELEGVICCCMAAGVSTDQVVMTQPRIVTSNGYEARVICHISFEG